MNGKEILVLGAGVAGLTTALALRRTGYRVTVLAERFAPHVTSSVAGALWEWPPGVCGKHIDLERSRRWATASLHTFTELAANPATGVFIRPVTFYFRHNLANDAFQQEKMSQLAKVAQGFRHDAALIHENGIGPAHEYRDAYQHLAPMIDTDQYLMWLTEQLHDCEFVTRRIPAPLADQVPSLLKDFGAQTIVNCTGFGSHELVADNNLYPLRGAVLRVRNDGRTMPRIEQAHCVSHDGVNSDPGFVFIVPRGNDRLLLGGFAEPHQSDLRLTLYDAIIQDMLRRCVLFLPSLKDAEIDSVEPFRAGLRPARKNGVRLEWDANRSVIHNYGHGGSGITYSWGCAESVARLLGENDG